MFTKNKIAYADLSLLKGNRHSSQSPFLTEKKITKQISFHYRKVYYWPVSLVINNFPLGTQRTEILQNFMPPHSKYTFMNTSTKSENYDDRYDGFIRPLTQITQHTLSVRDALSLKWDTFSVRMNMVRVPYFHILIKTQKKKI